ncbi:hypothetical protein MtrunA17_Chr1g0176811 [Medicago truncatula]|uniref:Transmembrane protein n=1 Tax=Medicago truncatula TaxID=3880 RepID=A0A396JXG9_MEDTR|nr:hypothetical protein MtrunA17_Chr1g0176811 [Medicago truncatula]
MYTLYLVGGVVVFGVGRVVSFVFCWCCSSFVQLGDNARKGLVLRRSVLAVVVIHVPSDLFWVLFGLCLVGSCHFLDWLVFTVALDAFSLSPSDACLRPR